MKNTVSVIINFHNGEKYLATCIESVLNQKFENFEWLIIDGGSTDKTLPYIKNIKNKEQIQEK